MARTTEHWASLPKPSPAGRILARFALLALILSIIGGTAPSCRSGSHNGFLAQVRSSTPSPPAPRASAIAHYIASSMYEQRGNLDQAITEMEKASGYAPDSSTLTLRLIRAYVRKEDYQRACVMAERAVQQIPNNANLQIVLGEIYHQMNRYDDALAAFQKAIEIDPENVLGYGALLSIQEKTNDLVAALDIYQRLAKKMPESAGIQFQLGLCLARINDAAGARAAFEKALRLNPRIARARSLLGVMLLEADENEGAAQYLKDYLDEDPTDIRARETYAGALARMRKYREAVQQLRQAVGAKDAEPRHSIELMYLLLCARDYPSVENAMPASGAPIFGTILKALARKGMNNPYRPLLESLDSAGGDIDDECTGFLNEMLFLFGRKEVSSFLMNAFDEFRNEGIHSKTLDIIQARVLMSLDRDPEAEALLTDVLKRYGTDKHVHYYLATICEEQERIEETEQHLKAYLAISPDDADVLNFLGYLYAENKIKLDEAEALLKRALELDPGNGFYLDSLGWVYYQRGDADKAIEFIRKAILAMESDDSELRSHLGDAYLLKGDLQKALAEWDRAYRLNPKLEGLKEKIDAHRPLTETKTP